MIEIAGQHKKLLSAAVCAILADDMFFFGLKQICQLLVPLTLVIQAVQSDEATLADVMRYWYFRGRTESIPHRP